MVLTMAKLHMAHASTHGGRKPPGPKYFACINSFQLGLSETNYTITNLNQIRPQARDICWKPHIFVYNIAYQQQAWQVKNEVEGKVCSLRKIES